MRKKIHAHNFFSLEIERMRKEVTQDCSGNSGSAFKGQSAKVALAPSWQQLTLAMALNLHIPPCEMG